VFYTPPVVNSPSILSREMTLLRRDLSTLIAAMRPVRRQGGALFLCLGQ
jgi:hypothetical protein